MRSPAAALVVAGLLLALAGCQGLDTQPAAEQQGAPGPMLWPRPPQPARIRLAGVIARPADLGIAPSIWERLGNLIAGEQEQWLVRPTGIAAHQRRLYVADPGTPALWIVDTAAGRFRKVSKTGHESLTSPVAVTIGPPDRVLVADSHRAKVFVFGLDGKALGALAAPGFRRPAGVAYDAPRDRLYVADSAAHRVWVLGADGRPRQAIGGRGTADGEFNFPTHVAVDRLGRLFVTDALGFRVQWFAPDGTFLGKFGRQGDASGYFASPKGVGVDSDGHVYVVDALFDAVQIFDTQGQLLLAFGERGTGPGRFWLPGGLFIDDRNRIYVADAFNRRIQLFDYLGEAGHG